MVQCTGFALWVFRGIWALVYHCHYVLSVVLLLSLQLSDRAYPLIQGPKLSLGFSDF